MRIYGLFLTAIILPLLTSCGGGDTQVASEGGIGGTGVSQGKVSGYGSIFVNGIEFETDTAEFVVEEDSGFTQDDIKLGMVVRVTGETHDDGITGTASKVEYSDQLEGVISAPPALDADGVGTLEVMQQTVYVDQTTVFDDSTNQSLLITDLTKDDLVEVSGYSDGSGSVYATRIELKTQNWTSGDLEIKGVVNNLTSTTFDIGNLTIDFSLATLSDGDPQEGWYVEAKGNSIAGNGDFLATEVELEGDGDLQVADDDTDVELEGVVTSLLSGDIFSLNGQPVSIADITIDETAITLGRELKVEGQMMNGIIEATEIEFEASESELQDMASLLEAVDAVDLNSGTITLLGQSVSVTSSTIMEDDLGDDQSFNLAELMQYDFVKVDVYDDGDNGLVAVKLERESAPAPLAHEIEGLVQEINVDSTLDRIRVLGVVIDISAPGITINPIVGDRVEISGEVYDGTILVAQSAEIEGQDD